MTRLKDHLKRRLVRLIINEIPTMAGALTDPGDLLHFPHTHSYAPPTLFMFGDEPAVHAGWVKVGKYCSINGSTRIMLGGGHHPEWVSTYPFRIRHNLPGALHDGQPGTRGPVNIGNDVWIGYNVIIQSGITIGDGAVIATGTVVVKDVPPYTIVGGNPGRVIRPRFDETTVAALLRIQWWDWPDDRVFGAIDDLCAPDLAGFIAKYG